MNRRIVAAVALAATLAALPAVPAHAEPLVDDPGDIGQLHHPGPSQAALDARFIALVEQIPGMHIINTAITDNGGRMVCKWLDSNSIEDTAAELRHDNPTFTGAEAEAFVSDAMAVYCPAHIHQTIG